MPHIMIMMQSRTPLGLVIPHYYPPLAQEVPHVPSNTLHIFAPTIFLRETIVKLILEDRALIVVAVLLR